MHPGTDTPPQPGPAPGPPLPADAHALEANWGCEAALPFLQLHPSAMALGQDAGAAPWPRTAAS